MIPEQQEFINELNPLNIEARYPEYKNQILTELSAEICEALIVKTEKMLCWIKAQL
jgi:HEPN domain-containing protein